MAKTTAIEIPQALLRKLHRIHGQRADLTSRIERGPLQLKAAAALVEKAEAEVDRAKSELKKTKMVADEKQLQLQSREAHLKDLQGKLNTAGSNKEFSLLKDQIAADEQANSVQSDEIFEALETIDELTEVLQTKESELRTAQKERDQRVEEIEAKQATVREQLDRVNAELAEAEAQIPAAAKLDYQRLTASLGEEALAPLEGESCGGCYQTLTTQIVNMLRLSQLTHCPNCNALLYLPEDLRVQ